MTDHEQTSAKGGLEPGAELEREIEQTRARMTESIDTIGEKLRPGNLAQSAVEDIGEQARRTGSRVAKAIRENPFPLAAIGLGVTWLVAGQRSKGGVGRYGYRGPERRISGYPERRPQAEAVAKQAGERIGELGDEAKERVQRLGTKAREQTRLVGTRLQRMIDENPLPMAAGAVVLGLAVGLVLPGTRREDELMGAARDQLVERGGKTAREVTATVKAAVAERGPEVMDVAQDIAERATERAKESAQAD
jgi:ElaB/YqjD/DUF883 family membrane-anchored ribosome-binding protein